MSSAGSSSPSRPSPVDLRGATAEEAYERVIAALATRKVSIPEALKLASLVKIGIEVKEVAEFRRRLESAEAAHRATLEATRRLAPARRQVVEMVPAADHCDVRPTPTETSAAAGSSEGTGA